MDSSKFGINLSKLSFDENGLLFEPFTFLSKAGHHPLKKRNTDKIIVCFFGFCQIFLAILAIINLLKVKDIETIVGTSESLISACQMICKNGLLIIKKRKISKILRDLMKTEEDTKEMKKEVENIYLASKISNVTYKYITYILLVLFPLKPLIEDKSRKLPYVVWFPEGDTSPFYEIVYVLQILTVLSAILIVGGFDMLFCAIGAEVAVQFRKLNRKIALVKFSGGKNDVKKINKMILNHEVLLGVCKDIQDTISFFLLTQFAITIITLCMELYYVLEK